MSNDISIQQQLDATQYITMVSVGILYYDYCLTLSMEVDRFWSLPKITWASFFFYLNRYLSLLGHVPVVFVSFWSTADPMDKLVAFAVVVQATAGVLQIMRTYAFYERNPWVLGTLIIVSGGAVAFGSWCVFAGKHYTETNAFIPRLGCFESVSTVDGIRLAGAWGGVLLWELSIFALTLYRSLTLGRTGDRTLLTVLLRDGSVYFAVIAISTLSNILTFVISPPIIKGFSTTLTNVLSAMLISRLMLNLRDPKLMPRRRNKTVMASGDNPFVSTVVDMDMTFPVSVRNDFESRMNAESEGIQSGAIVLEDRNESQTQGLVT